MVRGMSEAVGPTAREEDVSVAEVAVADLQVGPTDARGSTQDKRKRGNRDSES